jgi:uncharacterized protein (DUF1684 family)
MSSSHPHSGHSPSEHEHGSPEHSSGHDHQAHQQHSHDDARRQVEAFRKQKDRFFKESDESPLLAEDKPKFHSLRYYPVDPAFRVAAVLVPEPHPGTFRVQTTTGDFKEYTRLGRLEFQLGDQVYSLTAFLPPSDEPMHGNRIFVPFRDKTSAKETYGAGRYLDLNKRPGEEYVLDFNRAYNPFCAYSPYYSCPLPPGENNLPVEIRAGELMFHED